jgi:hypothetical protein
MVLLDKHFDEVTVDVDTGAPGRLALDPIA